MAKEAISPGDRSGVLRPDNLQRYNASRYAPHPSVSDVVDQYWHVRWHLKPGESIEQLVIDMPAVTLTVEKGNVPATLVVTGVQSGAWHRTISGSGSVFAIRLRPAGLAVLSGLTPDAVADAAVSVTREFDSQLYGLLSEVAAGEVPEEQVRLADRTIAELVMVRPPTSQHLLANRAFDVLVEEVRSRVGVELAQELDVGERRLQRALKATVGRGPKWVNRRIRLQEVALQLATDVRVDLAELALDLGYSDQAHLTNDFRAVAGMSPDAYRRSLST